MKLIRNWRKVWRMFSVQAMAVATAVQGTWVLIPDEMKATLPEFMIQGVTMTLLVLGIVGRLVVQPSVSEA